MQENVLSLTQFPVHCRRCKPCSVTAQPFHVSTNQPGYVQTRYRCLLHHHIAFQMAGKLTLLSPLLLAAHLLLHLCCPASGTSHGNRIVRTAGYNSSTSNAVVICSTLHLMDYIEGVVEKVTSHLKRRSNSNDPALNYEV